MDITKEELQKAFTENEEFRGKVLETISGTEHGSEYLNNFAKANWDSKIGDEIKNVHGQYDKDLEELGYKREDGSIKTYDHIKNVISELKSKAALADPSQTQKYNEEITALKAQLEEGNQDSYFKKMLEESQNAWKQEKGDFESKLEELKKEKVSFTIKSDLNSALGKLKLNESLPESLKDLAVKNVFNQLISKATIEGDNTITYYNEDGQIAMNRKKMVKSTAEDMLQTALKDVLAVAPTSTGGAGNQQPSSTGNVMLSSVKTKMELTDAIDKILIAEGILKSSPEYRTKADDLFREHGKGLPLR